MNTLVRQANWAHTVRKPERHPEVALIYCGRRLLISLADDTESLPTLLTLDDADVYLEGQWLTRVGVLGVIRDRLVVAYRADRAFKPSSYDIRPHAWLHARALPPDSPDFRIADAWLESEGM